MANVLILYSTTDGHTITICQRIKQIVEPKNNEVTLLPIANSHSVDLNDFDKIVIGASIRYGKHSPAVNDFIKTNSQTLAHKPSAFFSVNLVARKPEKNTPGTNPYMLKFLRRIPWRPKKLAVFGGKLDYQKYGAWDRLMIRLIMWATKGPTDPKTNMEFTDWEQVERFGRVIHEM